MSQQVGTNTILKCLSDLSTTADKILEEKASEFSPTRVFEWIDIIKSKANSILEENETATEFEEIPSLVSVLGGTGQRGARASTMLTEIQRLHLHPRREGDVVQTRKSRQSVKTPLRRKESLKNESPKLKIPPTIIKKIGTVFVTQSEKSLPIAIEKTAETSLTSISTNGKGIASEMKKTLRSSKRKSSSEIMPENTIKKPKLSNPCGGRLESMQNPRVEQERQVKAKDSSLLPNYASIKSSVGVMGFSASKKEHVLRSKIETKQDKAVENRKNLMALRQQKLEQSKKTRDEKMEKTTQQRQKLEKQKLTKLKSGGKEKTLTNTNKVPTPKPLHKTAAESETFGEITNSVLKKKEKEKKTPLRKLEDESKKNKTGSSALKNSEQKNQKQIVKMLNTTYTTSDGEQPSNNKQKNLKELNSTNSYAGAMKDISNDNKPQTKHTHTKGSTILKPLKDASESYAITPARSSFVSYDISEIRSDSEDEEPETNSKPIPSWATGVRLRNALLKQHHHPIDTDELFGNVIDLPDLAAIMGVKKKQYNKRTSSAVWSSFC